ncbi:MAG: HlyD family efflux transporter periplasmic adaptor subunit [Lachnospiraceae bacterium]|nr:HlyD family efflux transporter periplasmic adaptor subunit [Lachnospiraceae bacterium]
MANNPNKITKYRRPLNLNIGMLIFATIFVYVVICVIMYFRTDHVVGYSVKEGSLSSNSIYKGIALRKEKIVTSTDAGYVNYFAREGERAAVGNLIYTVDETGRLSDYVQANESGENTLSDADLSELKTEITAFINGFDRTDFSDIYNFKYNVEGTVLKLANYNMLENVNALNSASSSSLITSCYAQESGIVVYSIDGYEDLTLQDMKAEYFDQDNYEKNHLVNNELIAKGDPVYKLSTAEDWSIVIQTDEETAQQLVDEEYIEVKFLKNQYKAWASVTSYTNDDGDSFVALTFTNSMITFCTDRFIDIELLLEDERGLKIPNSSIVEKEFFIVPKEYVTQGGNSGNYGVLLETYNEEGNATTEFVETPIYQETETEYYLDDTVLRAGNYIIKPDSTDKYAISKTGSLIGVYNINKGYADFKQISILYQNDEYAIVKSNTVYGLNVYDYIVLDASTVNDNEFIYE